jgi:hypothetical protein
LRLDDLDVFGKHLIVEVEGVFNRRILVRSRL